LKDSRGPNAKILNTRRDSPVKRWKSGKF